MLFIVVLVAFLLHRRWRADVDDCDDSHGVPDFIGVLNYIVLLSVSSLASLVKRQWWLRCRSLVITLNVCICSILWGYCLLKIDPDLNAASLAPLSPITRIGLLAPQGHLWVVYYLEPLSSYDGKKPRSRQGDEPMPTDAMRLCS